MPFKLRFKPGMQVRTVLVAGILCLMAGTNSCARQPPPRPQPTRADIERLKLGSIMTWSPSDQRLGSYWPAAYSGELVSHNDAFVAALIAWLR